jgi:hypothetical protein
MMGHRWKFMGLIFQFSSSYCNLRLIQKFKLGQNEISYTHNQFISPKKAYQPALAH